MDEVSEPHDAGQFVGDIYYGDDDNSTRGTHRWDGSRWVALAAERTATGGEEPLLDALKRIQTGREASPASVADAALRSYAEAAPALPAPDKAQEDVAAEIARDPIEWLRRQIMQGQTYDGTDRVYIALRPIDIEHLLAALRAAHASGREEGERAMREALEFYANVENWTARPETDAGDHIRIAPDEGSEPFLILVAEDKRATQQGVPAEGAKAWRLAPVHYDYGKRARAALPVPSPAQERE